MSDIFASAIVFLTPTYVVTVFPGTDCSPAAVEWGRPVADMPEDAGMEWLRSGEVEFPTVAEALAFVTREFPDAVLEDDEVHGAVGCNCCECDRKFHR